jgi:hypothetical protein
LLPEEAVTLEVLADISPDPEEAARARDEAQAIRDRMLGPPTNAGVPS